MKKNMKKIMSVFMLVLILCFGTLVVNAADNDGIMPCGPTCTCGGYMVVKKTTSDPWQTYGSQKCSKPAYYDSLQKRKIYTIYRCNNCGYEMKTFSKWEYRTLCTHN